MPRVLTIGRDSHCDITLADESVSRRHAELTLFDDGRILIVDLGSHNGISLKRKDGETIRIDRRFVKPTDEIAFGDLVAPVSTLIDIANGKQAAGADAGPSESVAVIHTPAVQQLTPHVGPAKIVKPASVGDRVETSYEGRVSASDEFLPLGGFKRIFEKRLFIPGILFVALGASLWGSMNDPIGFVKILNVAICLGGLFFVYQLCGKRKPVLMIAAVMAMETGVMQWMFTPFEFVFRKIPQTDAMEAQRSFIPVFVAHFIGAGMMEELMKMTPVLLVIFLTRQSMARDKGRWGVTEPLDAILYACAAATTFVIVETLGQYVPQTMSEVAKESKNVEAGIRIGSQLAIVRTLGGLTGHLGYSGYFAYFVGLGLLRPAHQRRLWATGYLTASAVHGLHNATSGMRSANLIVDAVSFFLLVAAILNARKISPTRQDNFATSYVPHVRGVQ